MRKSTLTILLFSAFAVLLWSCNKETKHAENVPYLPAVPYNYSDGSKELKSDNYHIALSWSATRWVLKPAIVIPNNIVITLGRVIFFDPIVINNITNCSSCHARSPGSPVVSQALITGTQAPMLNHPDAGMGSAGNMILKMQHTSYYTPLFKDAYGTSDITAERISEAVSAYMAAMASHNAEAPAGDVRFTDPFK